MRPDTDIISSGASTTVKGVPGASYTGLRGSSGPKVNSIALLRSAVFHTLYEIAQDCDMTWFPVAVMAIFDCIQLVALAISPQASLGWVNMPVMSRGVHLAVLPLAFIPGMSSLSTRYSVLALYVAAAGIAGLMTLLFVWSMLIHAEVVTYRPQWRVRLLRTLCFVAIHAAFLPILTSLLAAWSCAGMTSWGDTGIPCFSTSHVLILVSSIILVPIFVCMTMLAAATVIDRVPDPSGKRNVLCASHGRSTTAGLIIRAAVALLYVFGGWPATLNGWVYIFGLTVAVVADGSIILWTLPFYHAWVNNLHVACAAVQTSACIAAMLVLALSDPSSNAGGIMLLFVILPTAYSGWSAAAMRWKGIAALRELKNPYSAELRARFILHEAYTSSDASAGAGVEHVGLLAQAADVEAARAASKSKRGTVTGMTQEGRVMKIEAVDEETLAASSGSSNNAAAQDGQHHLRRLSWSHPALLAVDAWLAQASLMFGGTAIMDIFISNYLGRHKGNRHLERVHLRAAEAKADASALDVHFFVFQRLKQVDDEETARAMLKMTVIKRMEYERLLARSRKLTADCRTRVVQFWTSLSERHPDLSRLSELGVSINHALTRAHDTFGELMIMAPQSAAVMRAYADFLLELANDPAKAAELLADAEQIEDDQSRAHAGVNTEADIVFGAVVPQFDLSGETVAILRVSAQPGSVGTILDANSAALKLWGYNRRELVGRDINTIVPEPISSIHSFFLDKFMDDGREIIVNTSRVYFSVHRAGFIFPCKVNVRPNGDDWAAVAEEIPTRLSFMWFTGPDTGFRVSAVCKRAMTSLGVDLTALRAGSISLSDFVKDASNVYNQLLEDNDGGVFIRLRMVQDVGDGAAGDDGDDGASDQGSVSSGGSDKHVHAEQMPHIPSSSAASNASDARATVEMLVHAKVQVLAIPFIASHLHVLRWRAATAAEEERFNTEGVVKPARRGLPPSHPRVAPGADISLCPVGFKKRSNGATAALPLTMPGSSGNVQAPLPVKGSSVMSSSDLFAAPMASGSASSMPNSSSSSGRSTQPLLRSPSDGVTAAMPAKRPPTPKLASVSPPHASDAVPTMDLLIGANEFMPEEAGVPMSSLEHRVSVDDSEQTAMLPGSVSVSNSGTPPLSNAASLQLLGGTAATAMQVRTNTDPSVQQGPLSSKNVTGRRTVVSFSADAPNEGQPSAKMPRTPGNRSNDRDAFTDVTSIIKPPVEPASMPTGDALMYTVDGASPTLENAAAGVMVEGGGRAGSVHSKSSKGSASTGTSVTEVLRRGVVMRSTKLEGSLVVLQRAVFFIFACIAIMNIVSLIITRTLFDQVLNNLYLVDQNGDRGRYLQASFSTVQKLTLANVAGYPLESSLNDTRAYLMTQVASFESIHQILYKAVDGQLPAETALYTNASVVLQDLVPGSFAGLSMYNTTSRLSNLANVGLEFISKCRQIAFMNFSSIAYPNSPVFWVMYNAWLTVRDSMNSSMILSYTRSANQSNVVGLANLVVLIVALILLLGVAIGIMAPAVFRVLNDKQITFDVILEVPLSIVRALRLRAAVRALASRNAEDENGVDAAAANSSYEEAAGMMGDLDGKGRMMAGRSETQAEEMDPEAELKAAVNTYANKVARDSAMAHSTRMEADDVAEACMQRLSNLRYMCSTPPEVTERQRERHYRHISNARATLFLRLLWPLAFYLAYYVGTFSWKASMVDLSEYAKSETLYSKQLMFFVPQLMYNLRQAMTSCDPVSVNYAIFRGRRAISFTKFMTDSLLYGDADFRLRPGLQVSPDTFRLFIQNGCVENAGAFYNMADCTSTFLNGLVGNGLAAALQEYQQRVTAVFNAREMEVNGGGACVANAFNSQQLRDIEALGERYLMQGAISGAAIRYRESVDVLTAFAAADTALTIVSILFLAVFYVFVYRGVIRALDKELKQVRLLLLLFPDEVSRVVPAIVNQGRKLLAQDGGFGTSER